MPAVMCVLRLLAAIRSVAVAVPPPKLSACICVHLRLKIWHDSTIQPRSDAPNLDGREQVPDLARRSKSSRAKRDGFRRKDLATIKRKAKFEVPRIREIEKTTNHDVIAFLTNVAEHVGPLRATSTKG